jgi:aspartate-semialdehyde dehydrogenase
MEAREDSVKGSLALTSRSPVLGLVGATGLVGSELISALDSSSLPLRALRLYASKDSVGEVYRFRSDELEVTEFSLVELDDVDVLVWASSGAPPPNLEQEVIDRGKLLINLGSCIKGNLFFPDRTSVSHKGTITVPSTTSIILRPLIRAFQSIKPVKRVIVTTFEGAAGAGKDGLDELWSQGLAIYNQKPIEVERFATQIAFNCIPQIHLLGEDGDTLEEQRVMQELEQGGVLASVPVNVTSVRVPVFHGHGLSVTFVASDKDNTCQISNKEFKEGFERAIASSSSNILYELGGLPTHLSVVGTHEIHVARVRVTKDAISLWAVADGLYVGAIDPVIEIIQRAFPL